MKRLLIINILVGGLMFLVCSLKQETKENYTFNIQETLKVNTNYYASK